VKLLAIPVVLVVVAVAAFAFALFFATRHPTASVATTSENLQVEHVTCESSWMRFSGSAGAWVKSQNQGLPLGPKVALASLCDEKIRGKDHQAVTALVIGGIFLIAAGLPPYRKRGRDMATVASHDLTTGHPFM
jgi:hypothetical protein